MRHATPKKVSYELIDRHTDVGTPMYALLKELVEAHHEDIRYARIALAWCTSWKPDVDGRVTLGKCKKASDLDRELAAFDFVILLRRSFWEERIVTDQQRRALLDHELCHAAVKANKFLEPLEDERGRRVYRIRKHDIEEFACIVERYGCYKRDLERFAAALRRGSQGELDLAGNDAHVSTRPLPPEVLEAAARLGEGEGSTTLTVGGESVTFNKDTAKRHRAAAKALRAEAH